MDKPHQPHITCYQRAYLTLLSYGHVTPVRAVHLSGRSMRIVLDEPLTLSTPVAIETGEWLGLGEVCSCQGEYSHYVAGLQLEQILMGPHELGVWQSEWRCPAVQIPSFVVNVGQQPLA